MICGSMALNIYIPFDYSIKVFHGSQFRIEEQRDILYRYDMYAQLASINPWFLVAQALHETGYFTSWWSSKPRLNFCGYGVTGRQTIDKHPIETATSKWAALTASTWVEGFSFASYDLSIKTHIGHILAYMYKDAELNVIQRSFVELSPRRLLLGNNRGSVKTIYDLNGKWAIGNNYGQAITQIVNQLKA